MNEVPTQTTYDRVKASFGPNAHEYTTSQGHSDRVALAELIAKTAPRPTDKMLDIGTGAGHTAIAFAPHVQSVVAFDLTPQMLLETERNAQAAGITNLVTKPGAAENLPFVDGSFDLVSCRLTTHHFAHLERAVGEMARVLKPGGKLLIVDTTVPEDDELDRQINEIEILRDPSHVRNYRPSEWQTMLTAVRLEISLIESGYYDEGGRMDFEKWTKRIGTSSQNVAILTRLFREASPALAQALQIELSEGAIGFALPRVVVIALKKQVAH